MRTALFTLMVLSLIACSKVEDDVMPRYERVDITRSIVNQYPETLDGQPWDTDSWDWSYPDLYLRITDEFGIIYGRSSAVGEVGIESLPRQLYSVNLQPDFPLDRNMIIQLRDEDDGDSELVGSITLDPRTIPADEFGQATVTYSENGITLTLELRFME